MQRAFLIFLMMAQIAAANTTFTVSAYCACKQCCGKWSGGPTASGVMPREGVTVAGPRRLAFGTRVKIAGIGERVIQDRASSKYDNRIDVFFASHEAAKQFGVKQLNVEILR